MSTGAKRSPPLSSSSSPASNLQRDHQRNPTTAWMVTGRGKQIGMILGTTASSHCSADGDSCCRFPDHVVVVATVCRSVSPSRESRRSPPDKSRLSSPRPANLAALSSHLFASSFISCKLAVINSAVAGFLRLEYHNQCDECVRPLLHLLPILPRLPLAPPNPHPARRRMKTDWKTMTGRLPAGLHHESRCVFRPSAPIAPLIAENKQENKLPKPWLDVARCC